MYRYFSYKPFTMKKRLLFQLLAFICFLHAKGQNVGINNAAPTYTLDVRGQASSQISIYVRDNITGQARVGVQSTIYSTSNTSAAVDGVIFDGGGGVSTIEAARYGVIGQTNTAIGVAGYSTAGTALRGKSGSGLSLHVSGLVKIDGLGEDAGKVFTSDVSGNASWQVANQHNHFGQEWSGSNNSGLKVVNSNTSGTAAGLRGYADGGGAAATRGVEGSSNSTLGIGVYGANIAGNSAPAFANVGVAGTAGTGTGVFGSSLSGFSIYGFKSSTDSYTGTVARFENQNAANAASVVQVIGAGPNPALELFNGYLKVSGTNKTAFSITATSGNSTGHILALNYANQAATDIILVTHNYNPVGASPAYHNSSVGVYWNGSIWNIYNENTSIPILGISFNVLVIKQ